VRHLILEAGGSTQPCVSHNRLRMTDGDLIVVD
jgi:hypothetical protein